MSPVPSVFADESAGSDERSEISSSEEVEDDEPPKLTCAKVAVTQRAARMKGFMVEVSWQCLAEHRHQTTEALLGLAPPPINMRPSDRARADASYLPFEEKV